MHLDFLDDLLSALGRVLPSIPGQLREIMILSGMPEETENLRYLAFNRDVVSHAGGTVEFSAVAVINNRRIAHWRLAGLPRTLSRIVFHPLWTRRNPMDLFLNDLRGDQAMMDLLATSKSDYTLFGILHTESGGDYRSPRLTQPVIALPDLKGERLGKVVTFETVHRIHA